MTADQIGHEVGQSIVSVLRPAIFDYDILTLNIAAVANASQECGQKMCSVSKRCKGEVPNYWHCRLLCASSGRPSGYHTNNRFDEIAASHCLPRGSGPRLHCLITSGIYGQRNGGRRVVCTAPSLGGAMSALGQKRTLTRFLPMSAL